MPPELDTIFDPWRQALGADFQGYRNHVERLVGLCGLLADRAGAHIDPLALRVAAVYHDLGIWSDGTFDYLAPSASRAANWLRAQGRDDLVPLVGAMIEQHHKARSAGPADHPVEIFRRADWVDVSLGLLNFGIPRDHYRELLRRHPDAGFHRRLMEQTGKRVLTNPLSPLPMFRW